MRRIMYAALLVFAATSALAAAQPLFGENFDAAEPGAKLPAALKVITGGFAVVAEGGRRFLQLPRAPLATLGGLFGPVASPPVSATRRFFGTKKGRKLPAFGISLGGAGGYRLQVSAAKDALEIFKADAAVA